MEKRHREFIERLLRERKFPVTEHNLTQEEQEHILEMMRSCAKSEIAKALKEAIRNEMRNKTLQA